jgi:hypothetical protein
VFSKRPNGGVKKLTNNDTFSTVKLSSGRQSKSCRAKQCSGEDDICKKQIRSCHLVLEVCSKLSFSILVGSHEREKQVWTVEKEIGQRVFIVIIQCQTRTIFVVFKEMRVEKSGLLAVISQIVASFSV